MSNPTDSSVLGAGTPVAGSAEMGDALAFTGAGPFTVLLAVIGIVSAASGAGLRGLARLVGRADRA